MNTNTRCRWNLQVNEWMNEKHVFFSIKIKLCTRFRFTSARHTIRSFHFLFQKHKKQLLLALHVDTTVSIENRAGEKERKKKRKNHSVRPRSPTKLKTFSIPMFFSKSPIIKHFNRRREGKKRALIYMHCAVSVVFLSFCVCSSSFCLFLFTFTQNGDFDFSSDACSLLLLLSVWLFAFAIVDSLWRHDKIIV